MASLTIRFKQGLTSSFNNYHYNSTRNTFIMIKVNRDNIILTSIFLHEIKVIITDVNLILDRLTNHMTSWLKLMPICPTIISQSYIDSSQPDICHVLPSNFVSPKFDSLQLIRKKRYLNWTKLYQNMNGNVIIYSHWIWILLTLVIVCQ